MLAGWQPVRWSGVGVALAEQCGARGTCELCLTLGRVHTDQRFTYCEPPSRNRNLGSFHSSTHPEPLPPVLAYASYLVVSGGGSIC